ncbi:hypothetical protein Bb109J_c3040 [Bdellovibrio bacteriovorus]|uniref:hypothetical protein n=2 Tax=Bdellovibrio bacteriovorus TaxID=959 RepID=UPI00045C0C68|nr:hypothetical protein [Bdellovibrio bacteriovorus]AHZ83649.1 hypothetical protein EP01_01615 [Bdellovibrio bacteriovorus]BEV69620.1 hypothetical protein Bb109J_c3040 [Bdellovibrio bacteriovorus]
MGFSNFWRSFILMITLVGTSYSHAATDLPRNLTQGDQIRTLQILGFGSASKILDNPYPLGGYTGIEVGLSTEFIPAEDLSALGSKTQDKGEFSFYTLTIGKGLYYNIDAHVYFTPTVQEEKMQNFGAQLRWGFYEASFFPLTLTAMVYGGGANFSNLINVSSMGYDLIATVTMNRLAIYVGGGRLRAIGTFIGGPDGITADQNTVTQDIVEDHAVFGINVDIAKMFIAMQIDRYADSVYSGKIGFRF